MALGMRLPPRRGMLRAAGIAGLLSVAVSPYPLATLAHRGHDAQATWDYVVVSVSGNIPPASFVVQRDITGPEVTVTVDPTTTIVRRFNGASDLSELSEGDQVTITGTQQSSGAISATRVQNNSVQVGHSQINGMVLYTASDLSSAALKVTANEGGGAAFAIGSVVQIATTPATPIRFLNGHVGRVPNLRPGMRLTLYGLSDHAAQMVVSPHDVAQIPSKGAAVLTSTAPDDGAPR